MSGYTRHRKEGLMSVDSLDWSKQFEVLSISRLYLHSLGIPYDQVATLTDEDMERIAASLATTYPNFMERVRLNVTLYLAS